MRHLRHFIVVAEELHFRRAAIRLGMTQPPLSQSIAGLEAAVGVQLFDRSRRQVRLTEAGYAFFGKARGVMDAMEDAVSAARDAAEGRSGRLRLTYVGAATYALLPRLVALYRERYPRVSIEMAERTAVGQIEALRRGEADVGLIRLPVQEEADLCFEVIDSEPFLVALPAGHRLADQDTIALADLAADAFVMFPAREAPGFYAQIVTACQDAGFSMRIVQEALQMHAIVSMVAAGFGVALVPASIRHLGQPGVVYRACEAAPASLRADLALAWRRADASSVVAGFVDVVRAAVR